MAVKWHDLYYSPVNLYSSNFRQEKSEDRITKTVNNLGVKKCL